MNNTNAVRAVKDIVREPHAWPGGYTKVLIMIDGEAMCSACVKENFRLILQATRDNARSGWAAHSADVHWEGAPMYCANCNKEMPSEYGDPDEI